MDATVNSFFKEINQIAPKNERKIQEVWQECYDEVSGYTYYWNTHTDEVTWTTPKSFKSADNSSKKPLKPHTTQEKKKSGLYIPPLAPHFPSSSVNAEIKSKIYSIQDNVQKVNSNCSKRPSSKFNSSKSTLKRVPFVKDNDSDDEKIELITEYGSNSDSDCEEKKVPNENTPSSQAAESQSDEDDDIDLLTQIQQRAKELKKLGGEVPAEVKTIIDHNNIKKDVPEKTKIASGISLLAGYNSGSSEDESENEDMLPLPPKPLFPVAPPPPPPTQEPGASHSTLFPITKPIDVKDFIGPSSPPQDAAKIPEENGSIFDNKAFQRKRRIGISLVNTARKSTEVVEGKSAFPGFGFRSQESEEKKETSSVYQGFQKGGVMFVKSDVLNASTDEEKKAKVLNINPQKTEQSYSILREKLLFLGEGREPVLPVQVMLIQAETLYQAFKEGGLELSYLHKWLQETCSDLIKLEKEAAPEGWLLQWDRSHKRYFYQNQATGENQWDYPEPDITRCDDAMDISTTPPPPDLPDPPVEVDSIVLGPQMPPVEPPLPPSPPKIRSPTPPPPPVISFAQSVSTVYPDVPLPPDPPQPSQKSLENGEPLPPGVDMPDVTAYKEKKSDNLTSALDSFYSEIAEVTENTNSSSPQPETVKEMTLDAQLQEPPKKKKKKGKLAHGLTMKQKGVSQLVEKWKNVQKHYGD